LLRVSMEKLFISFLILKNRRKTRRINCFIWLSLILLNHADWEPNPKSAFWYLKVLS